MSLEPSANFLLDALLEEPLPKLTSDDIADIAALVGGIDLGGPDRATELAAAINLRLSTLRSARNGDHIQSIRNAITKGEEPRVEKAKSFYPQLSSIERRNEDIIVTWEQNLGNYINKIAISMPRSLVKKAGFKTGKRIADHGNESGIAAYALHLLADTNFD